MRGIRGRYGQYRILETDPNLSMHLVETNLLSEARFYDYVVKYKFFIIKPLMGLQEVLIMVNGEVLELTTETQVLRFSSKEEAYNCLIEQFSTGKYYVIQAFPNNLLSLFRSRYTLHRKSPQASWKIVNNTSVDEYKFRFYNLFYVWKLNNFLITVAKKLGSAFQGCHTIVVDIAKDGTGKFWLTDTFLHERNSKWSQYVELHQKRSLRKFLPVTNLCTKTTLHAFLYNYQEVIIKPCVGQQGRGIVKITLSEDQTFIVYEKRSSKALSDFDQLYQYILEQYLVKKEYIVQQRISLTEIDDKPFDVRVITQLDEEDWIVTGILVKVAVKDYFVSNRASELLTLESALSKTKFEISHGKCARLIEIVCKKASIRLIENNGKHSIFGYDIGIDKKGKVWVIEGNYTPSLSMFYMFDNNEMYKRIYYYIKKHKKND